MYLLDSNFLFLCLNVGTVVDISLPSIISNILKNLYFSSHQHPKVRVEAKEAIKEIDYQIQLRIIEARQLSGMQLDPVCTVTIGNQKKHTAVKEQTNTPFWDEFFVFDFKMPGIVLFDKIINFQVFTGRNLVSQGSLIGSFKVRSVSKRFF